MNLFKTTHKSSRRMGRVSLNHKILWVWLSTAAALALISSGGGDGGGDLLLLIEAVEPQQSHQSLTCSEEALVWEAEGLAEQPPPGARLVVDIDRLQEQIDHLALVSDAPSPAVTRVLFTEKDVAARQYVRSLMESLNLTVREDAIGNIFGRWEGSDQSLPAVATGSHTDAIPFSGKFDGVVGVLGALEAISALKAAGFSPRSSVDVIMFTSEEPTRFGIGCLGSRAMSRHGDINRILETARDNDGISFEQSAARAGYPASLDRLDDVALAAGTYSAFLELHIEQGPVLEAEGIPIGVVTAIAAPASLKVEFVGDGGHAGGVLMHERTDAGLAAAELALAVELAVLAAGSSDTVGTTGILELHPGVINSIPRKAHIEIDVRDIDGSRRDRVLEAIEKSVEQIAQRRRVKHHLEYMNKDPPAICSERIIESVISATHALGLQSKLMVSRAYHDSLFMANVVPTGMIFIPCAKGISHRPDEFASKHSIAAGVRTLALSLAKLSGTTGSN